MKAMILGAGLSTRMRPLTENLPKPLVPFFDRTLLDFQLSYLNHFHFNDVIINAHFKKDKLVQFKEDHKLNKLEISIENEIKGTGGGIKQMEHFISKDEDFCVINCDFISDIDLTEALKFHKKNKSIATMALVPEKEKYSGVQFNEEYKLTHVPPMEKSSAPHIRNGHFTGIHIFNAKIFEYMPSSDFFCINRDVYTHLLKSKLNVYAYYSNKTWLDVGEYKYYLDAHQKTWALKDTCDWLSQYFSDYSENIHGAILHKKFNQTPPIEINASFISQFSDIKKAKKIGPNAFILNKAKLDALSYSNTVEI